MLKGQQSNYNVKTRKVSKRNWMREKGALSQRYKTLLRKSKR